MLVIEDIQYGWIRRGSGRRRLKAHRSMSVLLRGAWFRRLVYLSYDDGAETVTLIGADGEVTHRASRVVTQPHATIRHLSACLENLMRFVKRLEAVAGNVAGAIARDGFSERYPALFEYLTLTEYAPGSPRVTSTLMILAESGRVKGCVHDRDQNSSAWFSALSVDLLLEVIEEGLQSGSAEFRSKPAPKGAGGAKPR